MAKAGPVTVLTWAIAASSAWAPVTRTRSASPAIGPVNFRSMEFSPGAATVQRDAYLGQGRETRLDLPNDERAHRGPPGGPCRRRGDGPDPRFGRPLRTRLPHRARRHRPGPDRRR